MEENNIEHKVHSHHGNSDSKQIAGAIIVAGLLIAGAVLLKGSGPSVAVNNGTNTAPPTNITIKAVDSTDQILGNPNAKVAVVMYEDFQCPFCERFFNDAEKNIKNSYLDSGKVSLVFRDYAFLGPESQRAAEAARCAGDQGKFWDYHDYLFNHQGGENQGAFSDTHLKEFAKTIGLNTTTFNSCLANNVHTADVNASKTEGTKAGVSGTPKGYILKNGKVVSTIEGAEPFSTVQAKIDAALK